MANALSTFHSAIPTALYTGFVLKDDFMPDTPVNCICLVLEPLDAPVHYFGQKDTLNYPLVTMNVRSLTYDIGYNACEAIRDYFDGYSDSSMLSVVSNSGTIPLGKDAEGHRNFMVQFIIIIKE